MVEGMYIRVHHVPKKNLYRWLSKSQRSTKRKRLSQNGTLLLYRIHTMHAPEDLWDQFVLVLF
jgi:hypothetical protein